MNTALLVSHMKSTWRSVLQAFSGHIAAEAEAEARHPAISRLGGGAASSGVHVKRLEIVCRETSARECSCSCCVCLCRFEAEEEVSELNCKLFFHRECLERWFENDHRTCPLCCSVL